MAKVSVIVATYRRERELVRALDSLRNQSFKDIEIVIVDDNADEKYNSFVAQVVESFVQENPDIPLKYIKNEQNKGSAETRNTGIKQSRGEYITFLDDDDVYLPEKVEAQLRFMEEEGCDFSVTDLNLYNEADKLIRRRTRKYIKSTSTESLFRDHLKHHITGTDAMMFTRKYLEEIGGFPPIDVGDEFYLMHRAIEGNGKFGYLPVCHIKAYVHTNGGGLSSGAGKVDGENYLYQFKEKYFDKLDKKTIRYIKMRHYAVLTFVALRNRKITDFIRYAVNAFLRAPVECIKMVIKKDF